MGIVDGQKVDAADSNPAWLDANGDDTAQGKISFDDQAANAGTVSGPAVTNIQKNVNSVASYLGWIVNSLITVLPAWATNNLGSSSNNVKQKVDAIDAAFDGTTGHNHDGTNGNGAKVSAANLTNINYYRADLQVTTLLALTGASTVATSSFSGKTPGGTSAAAGVITSNPYNDVQFRIQSSGDQIEDGSGNEVYGRLTYSSGVWTITNYVFTGGVETAYTIPGSYDVNVYFKEVFTLNTLPTIGANLGQLGSLNATADIVDATATQRGAVSTTTQTFGGLKIFNDLLALIDTVATSFYTRLVSTSSTTLTANRDLTFDVKNANRTIALGGDLTVGSGGATVTNTNSGDVTLAAVGSVPNANAASLSGQALTLQPADGSNPGVVSTTTQSFAGNKTFTGTIAASNFSGSSSGTNSGDVSFTAVGSSPNANGASLSTQAITLQPADGSNPGLLTATTQTIGGAKTLSGQVTHGNKTVFSRTDDATTTGANATVPDASTTYLRLTNASLTSIDGFAGGADGRVLVVENNTGVSIVLNDETGGTAANRIRTGSGAAATVTNNSTFNLTYDGGQSRWILMAGSGSGSSVAFTAVGSSPNANGASVSGSNITLQPADSTNPGVVTAGTQTFGGAKTFAGLLTAGNKLAYTKVTDSSTTGSSATVPDPGSAYVRLTNSSLTSIAGFAGGTDGRILLVENTTSGYLYILDQTGTATEQVITSTLGALVLPRQAVMTLVYDGTQQRWLVVSQGPAHPINARLNSTNSPSVGTSDTLIKFNSVAWDSDSAYSTGTGLYTVSADGKYEVKANIITNAVNLSTSQAVNMFLYKNGSFDSFLGYHTGTGASINHALSGSIEVDVLKNDTLAIYANSGVATTLQSSAGLNYFIVRRVG